jgi:hypothetical protein
MKRTVTALYETREEAERARDALGAAHLGAEVDICDQADEECRRHHRGPLGWLSDLFGGHDDHHLYAEGLRRGHLLLIAKVEELNETRAAVIMEAAAINLSAAETTWRSEGWTTEAARTEAESHRHSHPIPLETGPGASGPGPYAQTFGGVRTYTL